MTEIWKDIKGYEGLYQVSDMGRVKSLSRKINSAIQPSKSRLKIETILTQTRAFKYLKVMLANNKVNKVYFVHRLVCSAFMLNPDNLEQINHKDGNKYNNRLDNLEWCSRSDNAKHSFKLGLSYQARAKRIKVIKDNVHLITFGTILTTAKCTNVDRRNIYKILSGKQIQSKGYSFELCA